MCIKYKKLGENFGKNFGEISEIPKIREKFPRKFLENFPENSRKTQWGFWYKYKATEHESIFLLV